MLQFQWHQGSDFYLFHGQKVHMFNDEPEHYTFVIHQQKQKEDVFLFTNKKLNIYYCDQKANILIV
jgi:hypothetical protein